MFGRLTRHSMVTNSDHNLFRMTRSVAWFGSKVNTPDPDLIPVNGKAMNVLFYGTR